MTAHGLLLAFSEVGDKVPEADYFNLCDDKNIFCRNPIPGFLSSARFKQSFNLKPTWGAVYDLTSVDNLPSDALAAAAKERTADEADVMSRVELVDQRLYTLKTEKSSDTYAGYKANNFFLVNSMDIDPALEDELLKWYTEDRIPMLAQVRGWLRSRLFALTAADVSGSLGQQSPAYKKPTKFIALHEFDDVVPFKSREYEDAMSTPWSKQIAPNLKNVGEGMFKIAKAF